MEKRISPMVMAMYWGIISIMDSEFSFTLMYASTTICQNRALVSDYNIP